MDSIPSSPTPGNLSQPLIPIHPAMMAGIQVNAVNARDLHSFLEVKTRFNDWIRLRIDDFGFQEHRDFEFYSNFSNTKNQQLTPSKEYALSLDMAKELAMVERNEKGKQARQYFIECERRALTPQPALNPANLSRLQLITLAMSAEQERLAMETQVQVLAPKAEALDRIATRSDGSLCLMEAAKALQMRPKDFFAWMQGHEWIYKRPGGKHWLGYQDRVKAGYLEHKVTTVSRGDGSEKVVEQVLVTPKGLARLSALIERTTGLSAPLPGLAEA